MNNLMPINLNIKKDYIGKSSKKDNTSDKLDFRKKLDSHSKKNDNKENKINKKNEKKVQSKDINKQDKEDISTQNKDINKQNKEDISTIDINESEVLDIDENKDVKLDENIIKEDLETVMSILQSINIEVDNKQVEDIQKNIGELIEKIENGEINIDDLKNVFVKLEDADFIPKEAKAEILNKLELMINQKDIDSKHIEIDDTNIDKNIIDESNVKENSKVEVIKEDGTKREHSQNKISNLDKMNENLDQNTSYNQNEDLDSINKNFLIKDRQDVTEDNFNFQNLNIAKVANGIKGNAGALLNNKVNNIDSYNIIDQITKKSNIITDKNNSSIQMQLEPENLGKLTLKVILERGILSAKFIAENDDVKTAIEENMEELKNNLAEQGINIQSLSVSVDSQGDLNKHKNILEAMAYNKKISKSIDRELDEQSKEIENPYLFEDDNFNGLV